MNSSITACAPCFPGGYKGSRILSPESAGFTSDDNLFNYQAKIIRSLAEEGSCIIIGPLRGPYPEGHGRRGARVRPRPEDFCLREAMKVNSLPENEVKKLIAKTDDYRADTISIIPDRNGRTP